ncbi:LysR family transcriptional regulator [Parasutterella secunda]|uniref:LysR family transcriptional regulator n=1 Tax=Parasutterella secunda TaxID=626947 RepID=UPI00201305BB|nr:LysR family transcriptional regulator [Parasutterella secunda]MCL1596531.1 LysR family transcriptional regulator [Parasutterella secunda]
MSLLHNDLDVFLTLCDTRSFSLAAQKLALTQSAITKKIQRLENNLGVDLFDRSKRPIDLTKEGAVLMHQAKLAREALERTAGEIREGAFLRPEFRVGTIESLAKCFLPSFIANVRQEASRVLAVTGTSQTLISALQHREIDFAFVSDLFSEMQGLTRLKVFEERSVLLMPAKFAAGHSKKWTWDEIQLCGLPYLQYFRDGGAGRLNDTYLSLLHLDIPARIEVDSTSTMLSLVANGIGWTITRALAILQNPEKAKDVIVLPLPAPELSRPLYLVARPDESQRLISRVGEVSREIFNNEITPELKKIAPWLLKPRK